MKKKILLTILGIFTTLFAIRITKNNSFGELSLPSIKNYQLPLNLLFSSLFFYNVGIFFRALRINIFIKKNCNFINLLKLQYISTGFQLAAPFRLGDGIRIIMFKRKLGNIKNSAFVFFIEKVYDIIILISILFLSSVNFNLLNIFKLINKDLILIAISFFLLIIFTVNSRKFSKLIFFSNKITEKISQMNISHHDLIRLSKENIIKGFFLSIFIWIFDNLSYCFVVNNFKQEFSYSFLLGPLTALASIFPSPPMGFYGSINIGFYWMGEITNTIGYTDIAPFYSVFIYGTTICISSLIYIGDKIGFFFKKYIT